MGSPAGPWPSVKVSLSARAAVVAMFACFLLCDLVAGSVHLTALTGFGFAAGSAAAAGCTRRRELLLVATTPPAIFLGAVTIAELIKMHQGHVALSVELLGANVFLALFAAAPWLFGGLAGALVIAFARGLPACVRDLRDELIGRRPQRAVRSQSMAPVQSSRQGLPVKPSNPAQPIPRMQPGARPQATRRSDERWR
jgi:hypothetical protein